MASLYVNSVQPFSITIAGTANTNTATLSTAVGSNAFLLYNGLNAGDTTGVIGTINTSLALTNSTTVTATRGLHTNSTTNTINGFVVDPTSSLVTAVQYGSATIASGGTSATATLSPSVSLTNSALIFLGSNTGQGASATFPTSYPNATITNSTTVTVSVNTATVATETVYFCIVTFAAAALNQSVQNFLLTSATSATTDTQTITSVVPGNAIVLYNGTATADTPFTRGPVLASLASATSVTLARNTASGNTRTHAFSVVEFASGVISAQRGSAAIGSGVTSGTASLTAVDTTVTALNYTGFNSSVGATENGKYFPLLALTNSTTVTGQIAASGSAVNVGFEAVSFLSGGAMVGSSAGTGAATGTLSGKGALAGTAAGAGTGAGAMAGVGAVAGVAAGAGAASGAMTGAGAIAGTAAGTGSASAALTGVGAVAGAAVGSGGAAATMTGAGSLAGAAQGHGAATGALNTTPTMTGVAAGAGAASGTMTGLGAVAGVAQGLGVGTGTMTGAGGLAAVATGQGAAAGVIQGAGSLAGTAAGHGAAFGTITGAGSGALSGSATGTGSALGTLSAAPLPVGSVSLSITESQVLASLRTFLLQILPPGTEVVRGQDNQVPMPAGAFVTMTPLGRRRLMTNIDTWSATPLPQVIASATSTALDVQVDLYGPAASDNAQIVHILFRDQFGFDALQTGGLDIAPLYTSECRQMTMINGENQYEDRWSIDLTMQINPTINVTQDFAAIAAVQLISVEATYPV